MSTTGVREVRRGDVSMRVLYADRVVQLACRRHGDGTLVPLDAAAFGRDLVAFFHRHEACSAGVPAVVVDLAAAQPRMPTG